MTLRTKPWLVLVVLAGGVAGANAQDNEMERRMLACDALTNESDRLACFNNVVQSLRSGDSDESAAPEPRQEPQPEPEPAAESEPVPAAVAEPAPEPVPEAQPTPVAEPSPAATPTPVAEPVPESTPTPVAQPAPERAPTEQVAPAAAAPAPVSQMPAPQADAEEFKENNVAGTGDLTGGGIIVRVWERHDGRFTVKLNNGQYWRETEGTRVGIPDVGDEVTVSRGLFGSYRMKIDGISRVAWVRPDE